MRLLVATLLTLLCLAALADVVEVEVGDSVWVHSEVIGDADHLVMEYSWPTGAFSGPGEPPYQADEPIELVAEAATADPVTVQAEVVAITKDGVDVPLEELENPDSVHARWRPVRVRVRISDLEFEADIEAVNP